MSTASAEAEYLEESLLEELQISKSHFSTWGRAVVTAIDKDDAIRVMQIFETMGHLGADINAQTTHMGYGNYTWTPWIHQFLGL
jgi:hypothetical protein